MTIWDWITLVLSVVALLFSIAAIVQVIRTEVILRRTDKRNRRIRNHGG